MRNALSGDQLALLLIDPPHDPKIAVVDLAIVVVLDLHDLVAGAEIQPNRSTRASPGGLRAYWSSMFNERAPRPPRFIGHST